MITLSVELISAICRKGATFKSKRLRRNRAYSSRFRSHRVYFPVFLLRYFLDASTEKSAFPRALQRTGAGSTRRCCIPGSDDFLRLVWSISVCQLLSIVHRLNVPDGAVSDVSF